MEAEHQPGLSLSLASDSGKIGTISTGIVISESVLETGHHNSNDDDTDSDDIIYHLPTNCQPVCYFLKNTTIPCIEYLQYPANTTYNNLTLIIFIYLKILSMFKSIMFTHPLWIRQNKENSPQKWETRAREKLSQNGGGKSYIFLPTFAARNTWHRMTSQPQTCKKSWKLLTIDDRL